MSKDKVTTIYNFFNEKWQERVKMFLKVQTHAPIWINHQDYFPKDLHSGIGVILVSFIPPPFDQELLEYMMEMGYFKRAPRFFSGMIYQGKACSFNHWHTDTKLDFNGMERSGCSIYLNETWDPNWGGWFCWKDSFEAREGHTICPEYNKAVILSHDVPHCTTPVSTAAEVPRLSFQLFFERAALADKYQYAD